MIPIKKSLLIALCAFIILRLPSLFEPHWYADEGIYAAVTFGLEHGKQLYVNLWDNKPPFIYYLYSLGNPHNRLFVVKFFNLIAGLITVVGLHHLLRRLKFDKKIAAAALFLGVFLLGTPLIEGNIANAENFFLPLIVWAYVLLLRQRPRYGLAGVLLACGFLFKFHPFFNLLALSLYLLQSRGGTKNIATFFGGFLVPIVAQFAVLYFQGNLLPALDTIFLNNFNYTQSYSVGIHSLWVRTALLAITTLAATLLHSQRTISSRMYFITLITLFELYGAFFGGRKYYHYLIQAVPACIVGFGLLLEKLQKSSVKNGLFFLSGSFMVVFLIIRTFFAAEGFGFAYPVGSYYTQFGAYLMHRQSYFIDETEATLQKMRIAFLKYPSRTKYIYTTNPWIYDVLEIVPTVKVAASYHRTFIGEDDFMASVRQQNPDVIVVDARADRSQAFEEHLAMNYLAGETVDYYRFWLKKY